MTHSGRHPHTQAHAARGRPIHSHTDLSTEECRGQAPAGACLLRYWQVRVYGCFLSVGGLLGYRQVRVYGFFLSVGGLAFSFLFSAFLGFFFLGSALGIAGVLGVLGVSAAGGQAGRQAGYRGFL